MKRIILLFMILLAMSGYSQNRYSNYSTAKMEPLTQAEIMAVPLALQAKYDNNQKYLYQLKKWVLELKTSIKIEPFLGRLEGEYSVLTSMENDDLARATKLLNQREIGIQEIITEYNLFISKQSSQIQTTQGLTESKNPQTSEDENYGNKGFESYKNKNFTNAILYCSKALEIEPENTDILFLRALSKSEMNDRYGAINDYDKIISMEGRITPISYKFSTVYNNKAYCLVCLGEYNTAMPFIQKALQLDQTEWYIWDTRAEIFLNLGEFDKCISDCTKAISIKANGNSFLVRGLAYIKKGEKTKGCQDLSKAGELGEDTAYQKIKEHCNRK
ncbi:tetratricopeptide repeat protein [Flavobacterium nackdongense]|uniref:Tetratricopeptide repeat protein n=1 Tax=Flavobacterium nackdongense TaxID=2547394 RepID=A0A4P6Y9M0_9FLAO|nr:hypothetical protein [Flavobacterium nackdongense]QBN19751.1 hypothetical protein E1750_13375 [Flavobacterium nackdongense]